MASETITEAESGSAMEEMELENPHTATNPDEAPNGDAKSKRERESEEEQKYKNGVVSKKQKLEEERESGDVESEDPAKENSDPVSLGPKTFGSSVEMFDYFYKLLHHWFVNVRVNKYEYMVLLDLIKKGHPEQEKKIGSGVSGFEIRHHPMWKSRCFFVIRADKTVEDFSFRKCVDCILPLPENIKKINSNVSNALGGCRGGGGRRGGGGGRGGGCGRSLGRGRGGKSRR